MLQANNPRLYLASGGEGDLPTETLSPRESGTTEDEMVGWHLWLDGHESEQTPREMVKDRAAWNIAVHGVTKSRPQVSEWTKKQQTLRYGGSERFFAKRWEN